MISTIEQIIEPSKIDSELLRMWEGLAKENKTRASLFNLIVFNRLSSRTDYIRTIVQKVIEKFPCRTIFISSDPDSPRSYLKTAISVVILQNEESGIACDQIDIGAGGPDLEKIPFLLLPHLVTDLPICLLWAEDPSKPHPLFSPLSNLATRIIFDSESTDHLILFVKTILTLKKKRGIDIADLNWARTEGWRDLLTSMFHPPERRDHLTRLSKIIVTYNARETEFFCHLKIQAMYILAWLASCLNWTFESSDISKPTIQLEAAHWEQLGPGSIISIDFHTLDGYVFEARRTVDQSYCVKISAFSPNHCDLPYQFMLGTTAMGQSLVKEICNKGTSSHYLSMLKTLETLPKDNSC